MIIMLKLSNNFADMLHEKISCLLDYFFKILNYNITF